MKRGLTVTSILRVVARYMRFPLPLGCDALHSTVTFLALQPVEPSAKLRRIRNREAALSRMLGNRSSPSACSATDRDLRLDLFRGIALWLIFLDHIPSNIVAWVTIRNYGFSDATEIFIFISGFTAAFVYGRAMRDRGFIVASARILKRAWQIYVAHIFLFVIYHGRDRLCRARLQESALRRRDGHPRFPAAAGRHAGRRRCC